MKSVHIKKISFINKLIGLSIIVLIFCGIFVLSISRTNKGQTRSNEMSVFKDDEDYGTFYLSIDKLDVKAPIILGIDPTNLEQYNELLKDGVAHMTGSALPGKDSGNVFIYGHSSAKETSKYSQIFARLDELKLGDDIILHYNDIEYKYKVQNKKIIEESDLSVLNQQTEEQVTLMTCWPIGTDDQRLVIVAQ